MNWKKIVRVISQVSNIPQFGLVSDVDGTISQIVDHPEMAIVKPEISTILTELVKEMPVVAIVSGRAVDDVRKRVGIPGIVYIGNHGLERYVDGEVIVKNEAMQFREVLQNAYHEIEALLIPGMLLEDKNVTLSLHYRIVEYPDEVRKQFLPVIKNIGEKYQLQFSEGRMVFELRPAIKLNKGTALFEVIQDYSLKAALYLGDDTTDVAAMKEAVRLRELGECQSFGIGVVSDNMPQELQETADYVISGVDGVERLLSTLLSSRRASST